MMRLAQDNHYVDGTAEAGTRIERAAVGQLDAHGRQLWEQRSAYQRKALDKGWTPRPPAYLYRVLGRIRFVTLDELAAENETEAEWLAWQRGEALHAAA